VNLIICLMVFLLLSCVLSVLVGALAGYAIAMAEARKMELERLRLTIQYYTEDDEPVS